MKIETVQQKKASKQNTKTLLITFLIVWSVSIIAVLVSSRSPTHTPQPNVTNFATSQETCPAHSAFYKIGVCICDNEYVGTGTECFKIPKEKISTPDEQSANEVKAVIPTSQITTTSVAYPNLISTSTPSENVGPQWQYANLTPETFKKIIQKIKSAPKSEIRLSKSREQGSATFYYSFVEHDPCEPLLKDFLVLEIELIKNVDEDGKKYPDGPVTDYYLFRDTDHDNFPEDYFMPGEPNPNVKLCDKLTIPLTKKTPDIENIVSLWEASMEYFATNLLK